MQGLQDWRKASHIAAISESEASFGCHIATYATALVPHSTDNPAALHHPEEKGIWSASNTQAVDRHK